MDYECTIKNIGNFGFYQKILLVITGFLFMGSGIQTLLNVFILYVPDFRCANNTYENFTDNRTIDECYFYPKNDSEVDISDQERIACKSWIYDTSNFRASAATDLNYICENADKVPLTSMTFMGGVLVVSFVWGLLSDWKGRKLSECIIVIIQNITMLPLYFIKTTVLLVVLRFFGGMSTNGIFATTFILVMEIIPSNYRTFVGLFSQVMFSVGEIIVIGIAYLTKEWHLLCLGVACLFFTNFFFLFLLDESPRWLISKGKMDKAETILSKIAKWNGKEFYIEVGETKCKTEKNAVESSFRDLFKSKILMYRALNVIFNWTAVNTMYYGLMFGSSNLLDNLYLSTLLMAIVELVAYIALFPLMKRWGRKPLYSSSLILAGLSCLVSGLVKVWAKDIVWLSTGLLLIGKLTASSAFAVIYNYTIEMFPTVIRNTTLGVSSCFARLGSMAAPYILLIGVEMKSKFGVGLPYVLFGILAIGAGISSLYLPETKGYNLPDTFEEGENLGQKVTHEITVEDNKGMVPD